MREWSPHGKSQSKSKQRFQNCLIISRPYFAFTKVAEKDVAGMLEPGWTARNGAVEKYFLPAHSSPYWDWLACVTEGFSLLEKDCLIHSWYCVRCHHSRPESTSEWWWIKDIFWNSNFPKRGGPCKLLPHQRIVTGVRTTATRTIWTLKVYCC